ncbi:MAG: tRNA dihydrouridine(20/20a) synthase DusA [Myxococcota bacterium]
MTARHPLSVAPMMDRTDRHFRHLLRLVSRRVLLYTEMVTAKAILSGRREQLLRKAEDEAPLALQLGGDDPRELAECAGIGEAWGYDEINLNVGCPSDRVQNGAFGVVLMKTPGKVRAAVEAMRSACSLPVTVKHRIGVDELDRYEDMLEFVETVAPAGPARFTVHARKAWLKGLSPKENRTVPPLRYEEVYRLKEAHPELEVEINGGIVDLDQASTHLLHVDAVMIGRAAYEDPLLLADADRRFYDPDHVLRPTRMGVACAMLPYLEAHCVEGGRPSAITRHMLGLFKGTKGARAYRRVLSSEAVKPGAGPEVLVRALGALDAGPELQAM